MTLLQSAPVERDRFVSHLYQSRREYRRTCETAGKSGKQSSGASSRHSRLPKAWALKGNFANGRTCCELANNSFFAALKAGRPSNEAGYDNHHEWFKRPHL